jgi:hypothetical protein
MLEMNALKERVHSVRIMSAIPNAQHTPSFQHYGSRTFPRHLETLPLSRLRHSHAPRAQKAVLCLLPPKFRQRIDIGTQVLFDN